MKRLISWLLALTLICGLLPMSVFAVEISDGSEEWDEDVDFGELPIHDVEWTWNDAQTEATASVTVPAGATYSYQYYGDNTMVMTVDGVEFEYTPAESRFDPNTFSLTNEGTEEHTYALTLSYAVGTQMNPAELVIGDNEATVEAGNTQGYYFTYTAAGDDVLKLTFSTEAAGWSYVVNNLTTYVYGDTQYSAYADPAEGEEATPVVNPTEIEVAAGDVLQIIVNTYNIADEWNNPAGTVTVNAEIVAGSESNPIDLTNDLLYEDDFSATVTVPAGETVYYCAYRVGGMLMTINDGEAVTCVTEGMWTPYTWSITNDAESDAEYAIKVAYPVGNSSNPATLIIGENNAAIEAGNSQGYWYTYTAEQTGTLILDIVTDAAGWTYAITNETTGVTGDTQWSDSDPVVNPAEIEVTEGDVLKIMVNTYDAADMWSNPAGTVTINASYKTEEAVLPVINYAAIALSYEAEIMLGLRFVIPDEFLNDEGAYLEVTKVTNKDSGAVTVTTTYTSEELVALGKDNSGRTTIYQATASGEMTAPVTYTFFDGKGNQIKVTDKDNNNAEVDCITRTVLDYAEAALTKGTPAQKKIATALVVYGGYAQQYFKVDSANPAYNLLTKLGLSIPDISGIDASTITDDIVNSGAAGSGYGIYQNKQGIGLEAAIYLRPYFYVESGYSISDFTFTVTYINKNGTYNETAEPIDLGSGRYGIDILRIPSGYLDYMYTVTATNNETGAVYTVQTSALCWVKSMLSASTNEAQINLGRAIYNYNQAANEFFGV